MLDKLRREDFESLVGQKLKVNVGDASIELEVVEATPLKSPSPRATPPFRLILRSRENWRGSQGMYRVEHPTLGPLEMFAVPVGPDGQGLCYEILFN